MGLTLSAPRVVGSASDDRGTMKLAYVCTNYNNSSYTEDAVRSFLEGDSGERRVVVVDNASNAENVRLLEQLPQRYPNVELILNADNKGYFRGLNDGIRHVRARHPGFDHMVVGNNDLLFPPDFVASIQRKATLFERYPVISPDIVTLDGVHQNPHVVSRICKVREFVYDLYYANYYLAIVIRTLAGLSRRWTDRPDEASHMVAQEVYQGHGACYVLGPVFFRHFEELWAPSFLMHEEYFLSKQLSDKGMRVYYEPSIKVEHHWHATMAKVPGKKVWEAARDAHRIYRQYVKILR
jgi:glycosyltransferase involved in cell wall biosynthesis